MTTLYAMVEAAASAISFVWENICQERTFLTGVERDINEIKDELVRIQAILKKADTKADDDDEEVQIWVKKLREASFCIEDVIDEYIMHEAQKINHSRFMATLQMMPGLSKYMNPHHDIAREIQHIKLSLGKIKERSTSTMFEIESESGSGGYRGTKAPRIGDPRMDPYFIEETQVVGFENPRDQLVNCLVEGTNDLLLVSVVGMGGLGKTTLAKHVFDNRLVKEHFHYRTFITVSQSYSMRELLTEMIKKFCKDSNEPIPKGLQRMDDVKFITQVKQYLESKKYLVVFDDVWEEKISDEIKHALVSNNKGSRIIVTTRMMHVAEYFKKSFLVHVHKLQPLSLEKASELFCNKAFRSKPGKKCPTELEELSNEIVEKCGGLPLAIVAIGGLLSTKDECMFEWRKLSQNLRMELERNVHLTDLMKILSLSYDDLPYHLKSCMLYFGIYPEDYTINRKRLTRQWMAEGFVIINEVDIRPLEEVAEEYLTELIQRSLVNVSAVGFDGKVRSCKIHDVLREVIIRKMKDLSFCHLMNKGDEQVTIGVTRRFSIAAFSNNDLKNSGTRAIFVFDKGDLPEHFMDGLSSKFKLLKVLDFQNSLLNSIPDNIGNLFHLRYLNLSHTKVTILPRSVGNLVNLETLDLRQTKVHQLPQEIYKLTKLRLLPVYYRRYEGHYDMLNFTTGVQMQEGIACLKSLQKLYFLEADYGGIGLIEELKMLTQLRKLGIRCVQGEYGNALCATIQAMNQLESLNITANAENEIINLDPISIPPPNLRVLNLKSRLTKLPDWIPNLNYLVKLRLGLSNLEHDPLDSLKKLPNLLRLNLWDNAFSGESLHFQVGGFPKLKELDLTRLNRLSSITIDEEALLGLEHFRFKNNSQLKVLPQDLKNLKNLQFLGFAEMPAELVDSIEEGGPCHGIINHIPVVQIRQNEGSKFHDYKLYRIPTQLNV